NTALLKAKSESIHFSLPIDWLHKAGSTFAARLQAGCDQTLKQASNFGSSLLQLALARSVALRVWAMSAVGRSWRKSNPVFQNWKLRVEASRVQACADRALKPPAAELLSSLTSVPATEQPRVIRPLRVRLTGVPLKARIMFARLHSEWNLHTDAAPRRLRLWQSVAMGSLAALFVMSIFSATKH